MERSDEIEPMVPELPRDVRADGVEPSAARRGSSGLYSDGGQPRSSSGRTLTFDDAEAEAPLVPDLT